jgi:hypothetical protein
MGVDLKKLVFLSCFLLSIEVSAQTNSTTASLPQEVIDTLRESKLDHDQALRKRFDPIIRDLSRGFDSDYAQLYSDAVDNTFFAGKPDADKEWREWQEENKGILEDPRLPLATAASALYLKGHLYQILSQQSDACDCYLKVLNIMANGPENLVGFHLMQESLNDSLLVRYYQIPKEYFTDDSAYYGSIGQTEQFFKSLILPYALQNDPTNIDSYWNTAIAAIARASSSSVGQKQKFAIDDYPRLILEESKCLEQTGKRKVATSLLEQLVANYPDSPHYKEITSALIEASSLQGKPMSP